MQGIVDQNDGRSIDLHRKLDHWNAINLEFWSQRAKEDDFKYNDRNTGYFHARANFRKKKELKLKLYMILFEIG